MVTQTYPRPPVSVITSRLPSTAVHSSLVISSDHSKTMTLVFRRSDRCPVFHSRFAALSSAATLNAQDTSELARRANVTAKTGRQRHGWAPCLASSPSVRRGKLRTGMAGHKIDDPLLFTARPLVENSNNNIFVHTLGAG
ncbi:hypothetical protein PoB_005765800 [Plakobranchus ocellatus]|uniref:Uncharacterized protein n=1 Tax=Plakobranchus ocellatus TaxID=259542 RepID=A0AAV4CJ96_9GAST|nr:hypothetical protein PoB_005765800 [Plakobranchus ocellatus]